MPKRDGRKRPARKRAEARSEVPYQPWRKIWTYKKKSKGENLAAAHPDRTLCLAESEKSALVMACADRPDKLVPHNTPPRRHRSPLLPHRQPGHRRLHPQPTPSPGRLSACRLKKLLFFDKYGRLAADASLSIFYRIPTFVLL